MRALLGKDGLKLQVCQCAVDAMDEALDDVFGPAMYLSVNTEAIVANFGLKLDQDGLTSE